jgi:hypothetical protein
MITYYNSKLLDHSAILWQLAELLKLIILKFRNVGLIDGVELKYLEWNHVYIKFYESPFNTKIYCGGCSAMRPRENMAAIS